VTNRTVAVLLGGCGVFDGSEIHESVSTLLALDRLGARALCVAPEGVETVGIDHVDRSLAVPPRDALREAARIARGAIRSISDLDEAEFDALIVPGGHGVGRVLTTYLVDGPSCRVEPRVERLVASTLRARKPIGAICLAPMLIAKVAGALGLSPRMTVGGPGRFASDMEVMGARHVECGEAEVHVDVEHRIVSVPAYLLARRVSVVADGIDRLTIETLKLAEDRGVEG